MCLLCRLGIHIKAVQIAPFYRVLSCKMSCHTVRKILVGKPWPLVTSRHLAATVLVDSNTESAQGWLNQTLVLHAGNRKPPGIADLINLNFLMKNNTTTLPVSPPHLSVGTLKVSTFLYTVGTGMWKCTKSERQLSSHN